MEEKFYPEPDPNKRQASEIWNERYGAESYLFGKQPVVSLATYSELLRKGKTLDVAMGEGRNAVFLASKGFAMEGIDCSSKGIEKAKKLAEEKKVELDAKVQNLDFFLMPLMKYDSVIMTYYRPLPRFFSEIRRGLVQGGTVLIEAYTVDHYKNQSPQNPLLSFEECYKPNEILGHLKEFQILLYKEYPEGASHLVQVIAKKIAR